MGQIYNDLYISIVIYNNTEDELTSLIDSLSISKCKVFVIDNSPGFELERVTKTYSFVEYIHAKSNLGYGTAHNIAIRKSIEQNIKYHVVINPDILVGKTVLDVLYNYMEMNANVGLCMPNITYPDLTRQHLCKLLPTPMDLMFRRFIPTPRLKKQHAKKFELRNANYATDFYAPSLSGCFMFMRTDVLQKTGGFDERFFMYCEDLDLCRRINQYSDLRYVPTEPVIHHYNKGSYKISKLLFYHIHSAIQYFNKWGWIFDSERIRINRKTLRLI